MTVYIPVDNFTTIKCNEDGSIIQFHVCTAILDGTAYNVPKILRTIFYVRYNEVILYICIISSNLMPSFKSIALIKRLALFTEVMLVVHASFWQESYYHRNCSISNFQSIPNYLKFVSAVSKEELRLAAESGDDLPLQSSKAEDSLLVEPPFDASLGDGCRTEETSFSAPKYVEHIYSYSYQLWVPAFIVFTLMKFFWIRDKFIIVKKYAFYMCLNFVFDY